MAASKIVINGVTKIDLTTDTVTEADVISGKTFHLPNGSTGNGSLQIVTYYTGTSDPTSSTGSNGDIYLKVVS